MKKIKRALHLDKETLRTLQPDQLQHAAGGYTDATCGLCASHRMCTGTCPQ
jgi:hypothetical protein